MRINLTTPFAEKEAAKALGARWDPARKNWYIENVEDMTPFIQWIPGIFQKNYHRNNLNNLPRKIQEPKQPYRTSEEVANINSYCNCNVLPWEDCEHTRQNKQHKLSNDR